MEFHFLFLIALAFIGIFILVALLWVLVLLGKKQPRVQEYPYEILYQNDTLTDQEKIPELHKQALVYRDFDALQELVREFGGATEYWQKRPTLAPLVAEGVKKWAELVESGNTPQKPKQEYFYYVGLMYEQGFECDPDLDKALFYFKKALEKETSENPFLQEEDPFRPQIEHKIRQIEDYVAQQYLNRG